jgi:hypothetical protein
VVVPLTTCPLVSKPLTVTVAVGVLLWVIFAINESFLLDQRITFETAGLLQLQVSRPSLFDKSRLQAAGTDVVSQPPEAVLHSADNCPFITCAFRHER